MTPAETEAMEAYLSRRLDLPAPPTFLSCTATAFKRAAMVAFHHEHVEATLITEVPANARLGRHVPRQSILRELVAGNTPDEAGKTRMKRFIKDVQRIIFDGEHTLSVVFMSHRTAAQWDGAVLRLRGQSLRLNLIGAHVPGVSPPALLARHYAVRILGPDGVHAVQLVQLLEDITQVSVLDVRLPGLTGLKLPDNDYWTVIFDARSCPRELTGVSAIRVGDVNLTLHHFQRNQQPPCWRCLNPHHMQTRCKVPDARLVQVRATRQRKYVGRLSPTASSLLPDCRDLQSLNQWLSGLTPSVVAEEGHRQEPGMLKAVTTAPAQPETSQVASTEQSNRTTPPKKTDASGMTVVRRRRSKRSKKATHDDQPTSAPRTSELVRPSQPTNRRQAGETGLNQPGNSVSATTTRAETSSTSHPLSTAARRYRDTGSL
ncbi:hypothetical protein PR003_g13047 [Phytophthora rubi]|uniref:Uncharacterized protein n=1 Tax=Phytophthora rubi TaxID=129364 RepID=A0A6A4F7X1_9STRA|nr:hypothetical protein PR001_g17393 [Phytophthora rubi]KAE9018467.1 hypothetical protein PR002_g13091 [Phytophthora rubi]KAE9335368.1 hypothetical protein PR003_g13047 [Phytophthora rubi]